MGKLPHFAGALALAFFLGTSSAAFVTPGADAVRADLETLKTQFTGDPASKKQLAAVLKALKAMDKAAAGPSNLGNELKALAKVAKLVEPKVDPQSPVLDQLRVGVPLYRNGGIL